MKKGTQFGYGRTAPLFYKNDKEDYRKWELILNWTWKGSMLI